MKATGFNGVPPEALKSTGKYCRRYVFDFIDGFWHNRSDLESWHKSQCVPVLKSGDLSDSNKWQVMMLMESMYKIFIYVINVHCLDKLYAHGRTSIWWDSLDWLQQWPLHIQDAL